MTKKLDKVLAGCLLTMLLAFVSSIAMAATVPGKIAGTNVKLRKSPTTASSVISKLNNSKVTVIDKSGNWYKVSYNNKTGWVHSDYVKLTSSKGTINANGVNFRTGPGAESNKIASLKKNTGVVILSAVNDWYKVKIGTRTGYVASGFVARSSVQAAAGKTSAAKKSTSAIASTAALKSDAKVSRSMSVQALSTDESTEEASINEKVVSYAKEFSGVRYLYGGDNPQTGFDCSGFIGYVYMKFGYSLERSAEGMYSDGVKVAKSQLEAGDILFFDASSRKASGIIDHVGIYMGDGSFIHASSTNGRVRVQNLSEYRGNYIGAKRIIK